MEFVFLFVWNKAKDGIWLLISYESYDRKFLAPKWMDHGSC